MYGFENMAIRFEVSGPFLTKMPLGRLASVENIVVPIVFLLGNESQ